MKDRPIVYVVMAPETAEILDIYMEEASAKARVEKEVRAGRAWKGELKIYRRGVI